MNLTNNQEMYNIVSMPFDKYQTITKQNLTTDNPGEFAPSDVDALMGRTDLNQPGLIGFVSMPFNQYDVISLDNLRTDNPKEMTQSEQLFRKTIYIPLTYSENPNAFRDSFGLGQQSTIPNEKLRFDNEEESQQARYKSVQDKLDRYTENFNTMKYNPYVDSRKRW